MFKIRLILKIFILKINTKFLLSLIWFYFFLIVYYVKRNYFPSQIIYNEGVYLSIICSFIYSLPLLIKKFIIAF